MKFALLPSLALMLLSAVAKADGIPGECSVLATVVDSLTPQLLNHQLPAPLRVHDNAMSVDRIDRDWATHFANEPAPPHGVGPTSLRGCIAPSATIRLVRSIKHDGRQCTIGDGIWLSRPAVDGDRAFVAVVENDCATDGWLVALERMPDGRWRAAAPRLLWFSLLEPRRD